MHNAILFYATVLQYGRSGDWIRRMLVRSCTDLWALFDCLAIVVTADKREVEAWSTSTKASMMQNAQGRATILGHTVKKEQYLENEMSLSKS